MIYANVIFLYNRLFVTCCKSILYGVSVFNVWPHTIAVFVKCFDILVKLFCNSDTLQI